ncbi:MAG: PIN domain-containing protein [Rubrivivax sp.]
MTTMMKMPDVNVLLHAVNTAAAQHAVAHRALSRAFVEGPVALAWPALLGFLRLSTRAGILPRPLPVADALSVVQAWLGHAAATVVHPTEQHVATLARLLLGAGQGGPLVSDAHLAALAIEHRAVLVSFDRDFERFAGLQTELLR